MRTEETISMKYLLTWLLYTTEEKVIAFRDPFLLNAIENTSGKVKENSFLTSELFVKRDHVGDQLQLINLNFLELDTCNWIPT